MEYIEMTSIKNGKQKNSQKLFRDFYIESLSLSIRGERLLNKVKELSTSKRINTDNFYVIFKNHYIKGTTYDDIRLIDKKTGIVSYIIIPPHHAIANGGVYIMNNGHLKFVIKRATWNDIKKYFLVS